MDANVIDGDDGILIRYVGTHNILERERDWVYCGGRFLTPGRPPRMVEVRLALANQPPESP